MRDLDKQPYSPDEQRVAKFLFDLGAGGGDDPIGFILASHAKLAKERNDLRDRLAGKFKYPSGYPPGKHWAVDEGWEILNTLKPGLISDDVRAYLGGQIAGALVRIAKDGAPK